MHQVKVTNLPKWISELHLKQYFESCGQVLKASIALAEETPRPLGHGYITFATVDAMQQALARDGARLDGAVIRVSANDMAEMAAASVEAELEEAEDELEPA